jgi:hypothetical protein
MTLHRYFASCRFQPSLHLPAVKKCNTLTGKDSSSTSTDGGGEVMITTADVKRHAEVIGLSLPSEDDLLWIAEAALKVRPPSSRTVFL